MQILVPADVEQLIIDELSPYFAIGTSLPSTIPSVFLRVVAAGGSQVNLVTDSFTVVLEAFAKSETSAQRALTEAIARLQASQLSTNSIGGNPCYRLQVSALPQNFPLTSVPSHKRYTSTLVPDLRRQLTTL